jgi:hypothetical protein
MLHLTIDCSDPSLPLGQLGMTSLPLLYCMRCELAHFDFVYQFAAQDSLKTLRAMRGDVVEEWDEEVGLDSFPEKEVKLIPVPGSVEALFDRLTATKRFLRRKRRKSAVSPKTMRIREWVGIPLWTLSTRFPAVHFYPSD